MGAAAVALPIVGAGLSIAGSIAGYGARETARRRNMAELERAAWLDEANAVDTMRQGEQEAGRQRMRGALTIARQQLAYAASGVDPTVGTPVVMARGAAMWAELDAQTATNNAARRAFGFKESARRYRLQRSDLAAQGPTDLLGTSLEVGGKLAEAGGKFAEALS